MIKKLLFILFLIPKIIYCQEIEIVGIILNSDKIPLEYTNIGIKNKNIGTIADNYGNFKIILNQKYINDILTFSYVGYENLDMNISDIVNKNIMEFTLIQKVNELKEIIVVATNSKIVEVGTKSTNGMVGGRVSTIDSKNKDMREFAKEITIRKPSKILNVNFNIFSVKVDSATFRINFYDIIDKQPYEKIISNNIIIKQQIINGWNEFDLRHYNLKFDKPFFITIEYIPQDFVEELPFWYSGQLFGESITKSSSLGSWEVKQGVKLSLYVTVKQ
ncbi:MAG: carboxypeptidase-like regulatory domain-containing protein [Lutibacter sp.]|nr:carboxypeptidase-like regulatory domain-containing protein [Lutibacter sp.]